MKGRRGTHSAFSVLRTMLSADQVLDGYHLIRPIGRGGFGEVWLCRVEATGEYKALKFLPASDPAQLERELAALIRYRSVAAQIQCPHLVPIEHVNRTEDGLFYIMPLSDDMKGLAPDDPLWRSKTLAALIQERKSAPAWFTSVEVHAMFVPLLNAVQSLSDVGIVHRDIKPDNILFIGGRPCLSDISLLTEDAAVITRRGTPGYAAPSWYLETGGNPDMWGLATTLFTLITGNAPDKLGRAAFLWPPHGQASVDQEAWSLFHRIILRATHESPSERFTRPEDMLSAPVTVSIVPAARLSKRFRPTRTQSLLVIAAAAVLLARSWDIHHSSSAFDFQLKAARSKILGDAPPKRDQFNRFKALLEKLNTQSGAPLGEIRGTFAEIEAIVPGLKEESKTPSREELNKLLDGLYKAAYKSTLGFESLSEEGRRVEKICRFQDEAETRVVGVDFFPDSPEMVLLDTTNSLYSAMLNQGRIDDAREMINMREGLENKLRKP